MERDRGPSTRIFHIDSSRDHAAWAAVGVCAWWAGQLLLILLVRSSWESLGILLYVLWFFTGFGVTAYSAQRLDRSIAQRRGDPRPLRRPNHTAAGALVGSIVVPVSVLVALKEANLKLTEITGDWVLIPVVFLGAWLVARLGAWRASNDEVTLGYDALRYSGGRHSTVVALRDISAVRSEGDELHIERRDAATLTINLRGATLDGSALKRAIEEAARAAQVSFHAGAALRREGRTLDAWREALHAKAVGVSDLRSQGLDRDDLEAALVHHGATAEERIGAALALRALDDAGVTRVRVAADAAAAPALRDALRAVADGAASDDLVREATRVDASNRAHGS